MDASVKIGYNSLMKFGDLLTGTITRFDEKGRGVFDAPIGNGSTRSVLVPFTTIGDTVEASFVKRQEGCSIANLVRIISPGPSRRSTPLSPTLSQNPGMIWADINYDDQVQFKHEMIDEALSRAGHDERVKQIIPCPPYQGIGHGARGTGNASMPSAPCPVPLFYRNRMDYVVGSRGEIGLKEYGSWNHYIDLKDCVLLSPEAPKILDAIRAFMTQHPELKPWDAQRQAGDLRYVVIREGKNTGDRLIALIVKDLTRLSDTARKDFKDTLDAFANNICLAENPALTDLSFGRTIIPLKGKETFDEIINGTRYTIQLNSFFQTNSIMAAKLQDVVAELAYGERLTADGDSNALRPTTYALLDLYCGLGFFAINIAQRYPDMTVAGYEIYQHMTDIADENAKQNNVEDRCTFTSGKAEDLSWKNIEADTIIVDPPRAGLHHKVIKTLLDKAPQTIIYISCNFHHLVDELVEFKTKYDIKEIIALDLFPHTPHVEVVVKLELK